MEDQAVVVLIQFGLRIIGIVVCASKATKLNRSSFGWGFFGFVMPVLAMIWIQFMKPIMKWDENINIKNN